MRLLARYLLRECLVALGYCFSAFLILWITFDLLSNLRDLQDNKMRGGDILQFYLYRIPEFLPVALPVALLLALLYALTNHSRYNEITAIRAAGVSLTRLSLPYFGVGVVSAMALFVSNELVFPRTAEIAEQIRTRRVQKGLSAEERQQVRNLNFANTRSGRSWHIGMYNQKTSEMIQPLVVDWKLADGSRRSLFAERAIYTNGVWTFYQVSGVKQQPVVNSPQVPLPKAEVLPMPEFTETPEEIRSEINITDRFSHPTKTHRADIPIMDILKYLQLHPRPDPQIRSWLYTKLHGRVAGPFACFVVVLLAVPFAAGSGRRNVFVGVAASIVIFFIYYLLQQFGFAYGQAGRIPAWFAAWFPNLLFGIGGLWLMARAR
jgi:lipopolysaccharide export system permease protein